MLVYRTNQYGGRSALEEYFLEYARQASHSPEEGERRDILSQPAKPSQKYHFGKDAAPQKKKWDSSSTTQSKKYNRQLAGGQYSLVKGGDNSFHLEPIREGKTHFQLHIQRAKIQRVYARGQYSRKSFEPASRVRSKMAQDDADYAAKAQHEKRSASSATRGEKRGANAELRGDRRGAAESVQGREAAKRTKLVAESVHSSQTLSQFASCKNRQSKGNIAEQKEGAKQLHKHNESYSKDVAVRPVCKPDDSKDAQNAKETKQGTRDASTKSKPSTSVTRVKTSAKDYQLARSSKKLDLAPRDPPSIHPVEEDNSAEMEKEEGKNAGQGTDYSQFA